MSWLATSRDGDGRAALLAQRGAGGHHTTQHRRISRQYHKGIRVRAGGGCAIAHCSIDCGMTVDARAQGNH